MTRSFWDRVAATVGVMSEPEIKEFDFYFEIICGFYEKNNLKGCCEYFYRERS